MILITQLNSSPSATSGIAYKQESQSIAFPPDPEPTLFCPCLYECDFDELSFYDLISNDSYKNDSHAILVSLLADSSTLSIVLKDPAGGDHDLIGDTFGTPFEKGFNSVQQNKAGYLIDWKKVFQETGLNGLYYYTITVNNYGVEKVFSSRKFKVQPFDLQSANITVKIEAENTGAILNGEDYRGMTWLTSKRIPGKFGQLEVLLDKIRGLDSDDKPVQVQDKMVNIYTLETGFIQSEVLLQLVRNDLFGSKVFVTGYDVFRFEDLRKIEIDSNSIEYSVDLRASRKGKFIIKLQDKKVYIKRNIT